MVPPGFQVAAVCFTMFHHQDPEKKKKSLTAEINNGRLAMMAIIGASADNLGKLDHSDG